ncbi:MAG: YciI family protein [Bacteroidota bacterium]|jgi:hypothetical protein
MKEFLFVFRTDLTAMPAGTPEQQQARTKQWMEWINGIASQNKLVDKGNRLYTAGKVIRGKGIVTDGPYSEIKESILGYSIITAASFEEAVEISKGCPILPAGSVEVREVNSL